MEELKTYYKRKANRPNLFSYDDDGNLIELNKEGATIKTIPLPTYRKPTYEEIDISEKKRLENIAVANREFEDARKELRSGNLTDSEIVRLNRKVTELDIKLQSIRFPIKEIYTDSGFRIRDIDFNQMGEQRKFPYSFYFLHEQPFTLQEQYVRVGELPKTPLKTLAEIKANQDVILFSQTNEYGYLSLQWAVELEFNGTMYNSVQQALYGEIAKVFDDKNNLEKIMLAEPDAISYSINDLPEEKDDGKWNDNVRRLLYDINIIKFKQYPELAGRLLETKTAILGTYIPNDNLIGIGISIDNIQSKNPLNWTGQNILGKALMDIRDKMRSELSVRRKRPVFKKPNVPVEQVVPVVPLQVVPLPVVPVEPLPVEPVPLPVVPVEPVPVEPLPVEPVPVIGQPRPIRRRPKVAP